MAPRETFFRICRRQLMLALLDVHGPINRSPSSRFCDDDDDDGTCMSLELSLRSELSAFRNSAASHAAAAALHLD
jgi:hypothetical protein